MIKKSSVLDRLDLKASQMSEELSYIKESAKKKKTTEDYTTVGFKCPIKTRNKYKSLLAKKGVSIQDDLKSYVDSFIVAHKKKRID